jgi:hypothetical protein
MKVRHLMDALSRMDPDMDVAFVYPSGDYWRTQILGEADDVRVRVAHYTAYHRAYALDGDGDDRFLAPGEYASEESEVDDAPRYRRFVVLGD